VRYKIKYIITFSRLAQGFEFVSIKMRV